MCVCVCVCVSVCVCVCMSSVEAGVYKYFASNFGTLPEKEHHHPTQRARHNRTIKRLKEAKQRAKKTLRAARKANLEQNELSQGFHQALREYSKAVKHQRRSQDALNSNKATKRCAKDFWRFAQETLEEKRNCSNIDPTFTAAEAHDFFTETYSHTNTDLLHKPSWLRQRDLPQNDFNCDPITIDEVLHKLKGSRNNSTPGPHDQISYYLLKKCPSLIPALVDLYNCCWSGGVVPKQWKHAAIKLLGKTQAEEAPDNPRNFRPIALTSCVGKVFTSILKDRWACYMQENNYMSTCIQKAFCRGVPGCTEHQNKLWNTLIDAKTQQKCVYVCWIDLANAFGSVDHQLIHLALQHYHAPDQFQQLVRNMYSDISAQVVTKNWVTAPFQMALGIYQGDPLLSVLIFNSVMNLYVEFIQENYSHLGYHFTTSSHHLSLLQYADDITPIASSPVNLQTMCMLPSNGWIGPECRSRSQSAEHSLLTGEELLHNHHLSCLERVYLLQVKHQSDSWYANQCHTQHN